MNKTKMMNLFLVETPLSKKEFEKKLPKEFVEITNINKVDRFTQNEQKEIFGKTDHKFRYYKEPMDSNERSGTSTSIGLRNGKKKE